MRKRSPLPALPALLDRKIYKTGQTRGADDDDIFQNRVSRTNTVLIPYSSLGTCGGVDRCRSLYEEGYIALIEPEAYFGAEGGEAALRADGLVLGENALVFYETRAAWNAHDPRSLGWQPASSRRAPLGGQYVARVPATTAGHGGEKIVQGFNQTDQKGAGIRAYEYASRETNDQCRRQLEGLFWLCPDAEEAAAANGMTADDAAVRNAGVIAECAETGLLEEAQLVRMRAVDADGVPACPLCLEPLSAHGFFARMEQAEGRAVPDLTVTQVNLFHIEELRMGVLNHRPYNVAWGHHHCNVVVRDAGIQKTLEWLRDVLDRNVSRGYLSDPNKPI
ncbi:MAG: BstXI family restriction endonuclease [Armatimonadetes bacterium]|nr:BstXI family restriction endonuclease [Armatimonadota bacterium]